MITKRCKKKKKHLERSNNGYAFETWAEKQGETCKTSFELIMDCSSENKLKLRHPLVIISLAFESPQKSSWYEAQQHADDDDYDELQTSSGEKWKNKFPTMFPFNIYKANAFWSFADNFALMARCNGRLDGLIVFKNNLESAVMEMNGKQVDENH